jgi:hypothetical protein
MRITPMPQIECALLYDRFDPADGGELFDVVETAILRAGLAKSCNRIPTEDKDVHVMAGDYVVMISQNPGPLGPDGFANCLNQPFTRLVLPDAAERVSRHRANTFVTITKGLPLTGNDQSFLNEVGGDKYSFTDWSEAKVAMELCYYFARHFCSKRAPSAVHWCPADHLVDHEFFLGAGQGPTLTPLFIRPNLYSSSGRMGNGAPIGMIANGSEYLLGRNVSFREAPVDFRWMIERVCNFIDMCHARGDIIPHGESFGASGSEVISVAHIAPSGNNPRASIELTAVNVPAFGIYGRSSQHSGGRESQDEAPVQNSNSKIELNANDPIDRAIMARLEERRRLDADGSGSAEFGRRASDRIAGGAPAFGKRQGSFGTRH